MNLKKLRKLLLENIITKYKNIAPTNIALIYNLSISSITKEYFEVFGLSQKITTMLSLSVTHSLKVNYFYVGKFSYP